MRSVKRILNPVGATAAHYEGRRLSLNITTVQRQTLDALLVTGFFGFNLSDMIRRFIDDKLQQAVRDGWVELDSGRRRRVGRA